MPDRRRSSTAHATGIVIALLNTLSGVLAGALPGSLAARSERSAEPTTSCRA